MMKKNMPACPAATAQAPAKNRLDDIDRAKGLAIVLVVVGHIVMRGGYPEGHEWFKALRDSIYLFHMPFFMYLSGLVMFYARSSGHVTLAQYPDFLKKRATRLLIPFITMGLLILTGKIGAQYFMTVDGVPDNFLTGLYHLFWETQFSPAISVWYVFVLFSYCALIPPLLWISGQRLWPLFLLSCGIYLLPLPDILYLHKIGHHLPFFLLGGLAAQHLAPYQKRLDQKALWCLLAFFGGFILLFFTESWAIKYAVIGTLSMPALHGLIRMPSFKTSRTLTFLGHHAYIIYLLNTLFIGVTKGVMFHALSWNGLNFFLFLPVLLGAGLIGPILVKKWLLKHVPVLDRITA